MSKKDDFTDFEDPVAAMISTSSHMQDRKTVKSVSSMTTITDFDSAKEFHPDYLMTIDEVADKVRLRPKTVYDHIRSGKLKAKKIVGNWRIRYEDYLIYINN